MRRAVQDQNVTARAEGHPEIKVDALLVLAEELLPRLKAAEWRDRAESAIKDADAVGIRDLRSIVAGADGVARDDDSRILAKTLRDALDRREATERDSWIAEITTCLDDGRVTRALRVAGRPPDPRTRFPAELLTRLSEAASAALTPDTPRDRWAQLLAALLESPVRRSVKPVGLPTDPGDALLAAARQASGRVPALASILGLEMPPPPGPPRPGMRPVRPPGRPPSRPARPGTDPQRPSASRPRPPGPPPSAPPAPAVSDLPTVALVPDSPPASPPAGAPAGPSGTTRAREANSDDAAAPTSVADDAAAPAPVADDAAAPASVADDPSEHGDRGDAGPGAGKEAGAGETPNPEELGDDEMLDRKEQGSTVGAAHPGREPIEAGQEKQ